MTDVGQLVREIVDLNELPPEACVEYVGEDIKIHTSRIELATVMRNLIGNSIKHGGSALGKIEIDAQESGNEILFRVSDDGPGIATQFQERVFRMFSTLRPRDEIEGTGAGLAIVKKIIETRGGTIALESEVGKGATFRFNWPTA